ncbi:MAG: SGNH/GDSL hydrolase family protein [Bacteroidales bacterium]|jgi:lysophospholipase L1-like esterase|nr:SGNH/GDSL hydrolase family protein [Bacteroidales bacterium]
MTSLDKDIINRLSVALNNHYNKEFIIYGINETSMEIYSIFKEHDINKIYLFVDDYAEKPYIDNIPVINKYDLLLEDLSDKYILCIKPEKDFAWEVSQYFLDLGLNIADDFIDILHEKNHSTINRKLLPDVTLLSSRIGDIPGFTVFGESKKANRKIIVTLGGSTSDSGYDNYTSWPEYFYRKISALDENFVVYSGGISGYSSTQELIKFIRDVVPLRPYLVISYGGVNDIYPLVHDSASNRFDRPFIGKRTDMFFEKTINNASLCLYGLHHNQEIWEYWVDNMRIMYSTAKEFGFKFLGILQPTFPVSGSYLSSNNRYNYNKYYIAHYNYPENWIQAAFEKTSGLLRQYAYLLDYTKIFSGMKDIFVDQNHVTPKGNNLIAANIMKDIQRLNLL